MSTHTLASTAVTGVVLVAIAGLVLLAREWRAPAAEPGAGLARLGRAANGPLGWSVGFFAVAFGLTAVGVAYVSGGPVAGLDQATLGVLFAVAIALVFGVAAVASVYYAVRGRGLNPAQAAGVSSALLGGLFLVSIVVRLFVGG